jgi:DNA-binding NarL/FixJ family response regulator
MEITSIAGTANTSLAGSQTTWTSQQVIQLRTLVSEGTPVEQIAARLNFTPSAIKLKASALGLNIDAK